MIDRILQQQIESTFQVVPHKCTQEELVFICPECGDKSGHRSVNLKTGATFCFRCGKGKHNRGNFLSWAAALGYHFDRQSATQSQSLEQLWQPPAERRIPLVKPVPLPRGFTLLAKQPNSVYVELIGEMARRKNLELEDFLAAKVGFTRDDPVWEPFAIFPVEEHGITCYYQGRTYIDVPGQPTKRFPKRTECPNGAGCWVYNLDALRQPEVRVALIVESILNVLSLRWKLAELGWKHVVPVCVFKHHISPIQAAKLVQCSNLHEACLLFDHDAIASVWNDVGGLNNRLKVTVAEMPGTPANPKQDPNDDVEAAIAAFETRKAYTCGNTLINLSSRQQPLRWATKKLSSCKA